MKLVMQFESGFKVLVVNNVKRIQYVPAYSIAYIPGDLNVLSSVEKVYENSPIVFLSV